MAIYKTKKDAAYAWVQEFNAIPQSVIEKLNKVDIEENGEGVVEVTPPTVGDRVSLWDSDYSGEGEIVGIEFHDDDETEYIIAPDVDTSTKIYVYENCFDVIRDDFLPMWGMMWQFNDPCDTWRIEEPQWRQKMADCGFRIYTQEDYGYIFGIDGAGYDFYSDHWIPLYEKWGLHWDDETEKELKENA